MRVNPAPNGAGQELNRNFLEYAEATQAGPGGFTGSAPSQRRPEHAREVIRQTLRVLSCGKNIATVLNGFCDEPTSILQRIGNIKNGCRMQQAEYSGNFAAEARKISREFPFVQRAWLL
jgi:hypothetical protein